MISLPDNRALPPAGRVKVAPQVLHFTVVVA